MSLLRIEHALLYPKAGAEPVQDGVLQADEGLITYAGPAASAPARPADCELLDAGGQLLMPGLVNAHTHLAMTLFRGYADDMPLQPWLTEKIWPIEAKLQPEDVYWGCMLGIVEMLRGGITCFNDMYHHFQAGAQAAIDGGIRAIPSGVLLGFNPDREAQFRQAVEFALDLVRSGPARVTPMLGPHAPYTCPDDLLRKVITEAQDHSLGIHIHLAETEQEVKDSLAAHGATPIKHMDDLGMFSCQVSAAHCVHLSDEDIDILVEKRVGCVHCPGSNLKLSSGFARVSDLLRAGAIVGLGTDGAASNNNLDLLEEMRLAALLDKGYRGDPTLVRASEAVAMAALGGAQALGLQDRIGTLEAGKRADCILIDLRGAHTQPLFDINSQLAYAARSSDVTTAVVEGAVLMKDRQLLHLDEEKIIAEATERAYRLTAR